MQPSIAARSILFVPAHVAKFVEKAPAAGADVVCLDLEDGVPPGEKEAARAGAANAIALLAEAADVWVRVNADARAVDLDAVVRHGLSAIMLPKSESGDDVGALGDAISEAEGAGGIGPGSVGIVPLIETARGILHAEDVCGASGRIIAVAFGSEDFVADIGAIRSTEVLAHPRQHIVLAAAAAGISAIDTVDVEYRDGKYLEREMQAMKAMGFHGKLCIHPAQVAIANRVFAPSEQEIEDAREIVATFERDGLAKGRAAVSIGGKMIDTPHYERAKRLLGMIGTENE